jgi:hypothetical protein
MFDLKKDDPTATVYSVLCQAGRQPHIYNEAEAARLPPKRRAALVRYWNFTEQAPAYYECPDARYPHLSFRSGQHPLGYFLPCCKMTRAPPGSRAAFVNEQAARLRDGPQGTAPAPGRAAAAPEPAAAGAADSSAADVSVSRHVLSYGKAVPDGRISDAPREVADGLFLDALPPPYRLQLVGVEQAVPAVPHAGFAYALAYLAAEGDTPLDAVLQELAAAAAAMEGTHHALGGGGGAAFASAAALADAILGAFVRRDADFSEFGPGGAAEASWPAILAELARFTHEIEVITLADPTGQGAVALEAAPDTVAALAALAPCGGPGCGGGPMMAAAAPRLGLVATGPAGTYPVAALDPKFFLRVQPSRRWMAGRRVFTAAADDAPAAEGRVVDQVAAVVRGALLAARGAHPDRTAPDLALITRFAKAAGLTIETRIANLRNSCYGVLAARGGARVYLPVRYSAYPADGTPVTFGVRPAGPLPAAALAATLAALNEYIRSAGEPFDEIRQGATLINAAGRAAGFCSAGPAPLWWYFDDAGGAAEAEAAAAAVAAVLGPPADAPIHFPYASRDIDLAIADAQRASRTATLEPDPSAPLAMAAATRNRLYRLFLAEFSAVLRADRDPKLRAALHAALQATQFESARSVAALRRRLSELLQRFPEDLQVVRDAVARAVNTAPRAPAAAAIAAIDATSFVFDRRTLARLRAIPTRPGVVGALKALLGARVAADPRPAAAQANAQNVYVSCAEQTSVPQGQCAGRRLLVPAEKLEDFYDILAADVGNRWKESLLAAVSAGVFDPLEFRRRPGEQLHVTVGAAGTR